MAHAIMNTKAVVFLLSSLWVLTCTRPSVCLFAGKCTHTHTHGSTENESD